jgi:hypothetical protein
MNVYEIFSHLDEKWSEKYKRSINCAHPKGFSQRAHCQGRKKNEAIDTHKFALPAKNLSQLYDIKRQLSQPQTAQPEAPAAEPVPVAQPEPQKDLATLQRERAKLDKIIDLVQNTIPALVNRAEHTRIGIPPGLAADLELDYPTPTTEQEMDEYLVFLQRKVEMLGNHIKRARLVYRESINESVTNKFVKKFLPWVARELDIKQLPKIKLIDKPINDSFGTYDSAENCLYLVTGGRHPVDVLRTLAHELTHHKQNLAGVLDPHSGQTGTEEENQANANAGIVMRNFNTEHPEYIHGVNEDSPGNLRRKAGLKKGETMSHADLMRLHGRATEMKRSKNRATRERGIKLARQLTWYKNVHKKKSEAVGYE